MKKYLSLKRNYFNKDDLRHRLMSYFKCFSFYCIILSVLAFIFIYYFKCFSFHFYCIILSVVAFIVCGYEIYKHITYIKIKKKK